MLMHAYLNNKSLHTQHFITTTMTKDVSSTHLVFFISPPKQTQKSTVQISSTLAGILITILSLLPRFFLYFLWRKKIRFCMLWYLLGYKCVCAHRIMCIYDCVCVCVHMHVYTCSCVCVCADCACKSLCACSHTQHFITTTMTKDVSSTQLISSLFFPQNKPKKSTVQSSQTHSSTLPAHSTLVILLPLSCHASCCTSCGGRKYASACCGTCWGTDALACRHGNSSVALTAEAHCL